MSGLLGNLLLGGLLLGSLILVIFIMTRGHRPPYVLTAALAGRWKGKVHGGGILSGTWVEIRVDDVAGAVTFGEANKGSGGWTRVHLDWPSDKRLRIVPEGFVTNLRRLLGAGEMHFDDPYFDRKYWIESSHPSWAREILDNPTRRGVVANSSGLEGGLTLDVGPAGIVLRANHVLVDEPRTLGSFIELAIAVLMKAKGLGTAAGVKIEAVHARVGSACPICGHAVPESGIACPSCRTPHHLDCWSYLGGCALFGCRTSSRS